MGLFWRCPPLLVATAFLLGGCSGSSGHSLHYIYTVVWAPEQGVSDFILAAYLDDQLSGHYNGTTRRAVSRQPWAREMEKDDPHLLVWHTQGARRSEQSMKMHLMSLQNIYNLSRGLHTWQRMIGCELSEDGRKKGLYQFGYNGEDYISFDKETLSWTAATLPAQVAKRKWDTNLARSQFVKNFLEEECIGWLHKSLDYGKESLLRREPPMVTVTRKADYDGLETLVCRAHGFHPRDIDATWTKDGEVWEQETFRGGVVPNSDGTYHTWLSIKIPPKDRDRYRCHVEHDSLPEPLDFAWEKPGLSTAVLIVGILVPLVAFLFAFGIILYFRRRRREAARKMPPNE